MAISDGAAPAARSGPPEDVLLRSSLGTAGDAPPSASAGWRGPAGALSAVRVCDRPCGPCPWRVDNAGRHGYDNLPDYAAGTIPGEPDFGQLVTDEPLAPFGLLFNCHRRAAQTWACAGHLAVVGRAHPLVRLGIGLGLLDPAVLTPGANWPALHASYAAMLAATGHDPATTGPQPAR